MWRGSSQITADDFTPAKPVSHTAQQLRRRRRRLRFDLQTLGRSIWFNSLIINQGGKKEGIYKGLMGNRSQGEHIAAQGEIRTASDWAEKIILWISRANESIQPHLEKGSGFLRLQAGLAENTSGFVRWKGENIWPFSTLLASEGGEAWPGCSSPMRFLPFFLCLVPQQTVLSRGSHKVGFFRRKTYAASSGKRLYNSCLHRNHDQTFIN